MIRMKHAKWPVEHIPIRVVAFATAIMFNLLTLITIRQITIPII